MKAKSLHFTVDPDGLTRLVRDMWAEGNYDKCLNVLGASKSGGPLALDVQYDIIRGKKRFANWKGERDQFCIEKDDWKPSKIAFYPDPAPSRLASALQKKSDKDSEREISRALGGYSEPEEVKTVARPARVQRRIVKRYKMQMFGGYSSLEEMNMAYLAKRNIPTIDDQIAAMHSRDEREGKKPLPDRKLSTRMGWILPNGGFYSCLTKMEHVWLAAQFGKTESQAENAGWIKTTVGLTGETHIFKGEKEPTQKQINTVFDWCEKYKVTLPHWAGGKDE